MANEVLLAVELQTSNKIITKTKRADISVIHEYIPGHMTQPYIHMRYTCTRYRTHIYNRVGRYVLTIQ